MPRPGGLLLRAAVGIGGATGAAVVTRRILQAEEQAPHPSLLAAAAQRWGAGVVDTCYLDTWVCQQKPTSPAAVIDGNALARAHYTCSAYQPEIFLFVWLGLGPWFARHAGLGYGGEFEASVPADFTEPGTRCIFNAVRSISGPAASEGAEVVFDWGDEEHGGQTIVARDPAGHVVFGTMTRDRPSNLLMHALWQFHRM